LKRQAIGKFVYGLSMLDLEEDRQEWAEELERRAQGIVSPPPKH
jgi:hypothetical protein